MSTKLHTRQVLSRDLLQRLAPNATSEELDNLLRSINFETTPILELKATATPSLTVNVGSSFVQNLETNYKKAAPAIKLGLPSLTSGSIVLPAAHNGTVTVTPGTNFNLNCPTGQFASLLVSITKNNDLLVINGAPQSSQSAAIANTPKSKSGTLAIGAILVRNVGGVIQAVSPSDIYQFGSGAGGGGAEIEIDVVLGENLSINDPVYISKGAADGGRTAGRAYLLDNTNDNRMEFIGFLTESGSTGETKTVKIIGILEGLSGLTPGLPVYWDAGALTQTEPNTGGTWQIVVGKAISATEILINPDLASSAIYIENSPGSVTINNNQTVPASIALLNIDSNSYRGFSVEYWVRRVTNTQEFVECGELRGVYNTTTSTWIMNNYGIVGDAGVDFTIDNTGQVKYTSDNLTNYVSGVMKFEIKTLLEN
jgi:hypothetical protein